MKREVARSLLLLLHLEHIDQLEQPGLEPVWAPAGLDHDLHVAGAMPVGARVVDVDEIAAAPAEQRQHAR